MLAIFAALLVAGVFAVNSYAPPLSPDSWGYFELARSFSGDPYAISTWRSYASAVPYSTSFPPLWPLLIAGADRLLGMGIHSGYVLNGVLFVAFACVAEAAVRGACGRRWLGVASALLLFSFPPFQTELLAARAIPLQLTLLAGVLWTMTHRGLPPLVRAAGLGLLGGALVMVRFDSLFFAGGLVLATAFVARDWRALPVAAAALLLPLIPWVLFSSQHFGLIFATDNAQVALSVDPREFVTNFHVEPPPGLTDDPVRWAWKLVLHLPGLFGALLLVALNALPGTMLVVSALRRSGGSAALRRCTDLEWWRTTPGQAMLLLVLTLLPIGAFLVTGYFNERYFSATVWMCELTALLAIANAWRATDARLLGICALLAVVLGLKVTLAPAVREGQAWLDRPHIGFDPRLRDPAGFKPLLDCIDATTPEAAVLFADPTTAARFGALTGHRAAMQPRNWGTLDAAEIAEFLRRFGIRYAVPDARLPLPAGLAGPGADACASRVLLLQPERRSP